MCYNLFPHTGSPPTIRSMSPFFVMKNSVGIDWIWAATARAWLPCSIEIDDNWRDACIVVPSEVLLIIFDILHNRFNFLMS